MSTGNPKRSAAEQQRRAAEVRDAPSLAALYAIARRRGYKPEWAERLHTARQAKKKPAGVPPVFFLTGSRTVDWSGL
jgi:hypothetical protein